MRQAASGALTINLGDAKTVDMAEKIMVVEDDETLRETVAYNLRRQGYEVVAVGDGREAIRAAGEAEPQLVILDVMLPGLDGFDVCRILRRESSVPIIMLTARTDEVDKVVGLEMGADDYLTKPFSMRELLARVKAQLRRVRLDRDEVLSGNSAAASVEAAASLTFDNLVIDQARREVRLDGRPLRLKPKEYELLLFLARNRGIALSRDLVLERVWDWHHEGSSRTVDVHIRWLREKIEPDPAQSRRIVTVRGVGYRFEG